MSYKTGPYIPSNSSTNKRDRLAYLHSTVKTRYWICHAHPYINVAVSDSPNSYLNAIDQFWTISTGHEV